MPQSVIFMGTPDFAVPILAGLLADDRYSIDAVVTQPDRPQGRKQVLTASPVKLAAQAAGCPVFQPEKLSGSPELAELIALQPDFIITAAFGQFLPTTLLDAAQIAAVNVHGSLLPKYRGGAPVHYAIMNGDAETGITIMYMTAKMDAGDMIRQATVPIGPQDTVGTLMPVLSTVGRDLLLATLPTLIDGSAQPVAQDLAAVTFSPTITRDQQHLDVANETAQALNWHIRGLYPTHPAYVTVGGQRMRIVDSAPSTATTTQQPGTIVTKTKKQFAIAAAAGTVLQITTLQPAGKALMPITAYLNGAASHYQVGDQWIDKN